MARKNKNKNYLYLLIIPAAFISLLTALCIIGAISGIISSVTENPGDIGQDITENIESVTDITENEPPPETEQKAEPTESKPEQEQAPAVETKPEEESKPEEIQPPVETKQEEQPKPEEAPPEPKADSYFRVTFVDVGQADAALIECDGKYMLIDGGNRSDSDRMFRLLKDKEITHLDFVIGTHVHEDHVGGLAGALNRASVSTVFSTTDSYDSKAFGNFVKYSEKHGAKITVPEVGYEFSLGSAKVKILACNSGKETNDTSIICRIVYGNNSFLFTGDAERAAEQVVLDSGFELKSDVLKVGHHGSENSTTYPFLREIMPKYAVISVGKDNNYGHPTEEALSRLRDANATVYRTDFHGDIVMESDGNTLTVTTEK